MGFASVARIARCGVAAATACLEHTALRLLLPPACGWCGQPLDRDLPFCDDCRLALAPPLAAQCRRCGAPATSASIAAQCPHCASDSFHFRAVAALGAYRGPLRMAVLRIKESRAQLLALALGRVLAERLAEDLAARPTTAADPPWDVVVPAAAHWRRRWARGGNPPAWIAEPIARRFGLPAPAGILRLNRNPKRQSTLPPTTRRQNVRQSAVVSERYDWKDARVLLVDDILTTGATAHEAARAMKAAGARQIDVAVIARGIGLEG